MKSKLIISKPNQDGTTVLKLEKGADRRALLDLEGKDIDIRLATENEKAEVIPARTFMLGEIRDLLEEAKSLWKAEMERDWEEIANLKARLDLAIYVMDSPPERFHSDLIKRKIRGLEPIDSGTSDEPVRQFGVTDEKAVGDYVQSESPQTADAETEGGGGE